MLVVTRSSACVPGELRSAVTIWPESPLVHIICVGLRTSRVQLPRRTQSALELRTGDHRGRGGGCYKSAGEGKGPWTLVPHADAPVELEAQWSRSWKSGVGRGRRSPSIGIR